ncbi:recombinase family protein [Pectobacterium versatile]|uniref:recombinase family protein n=1 Tax=Pectobacterium versatile TaxID=2488639 RepID=UPI00102F0C92|nr:recombinase family protein [Pectobacterium versatile]TAJ01888.1 recombinase family protein [Pectobacterium versatile]
MSGLKPHIYIRVSKTNQIQGSGLDEQEARIREYIKGKSHLFNGEPIVWKDEGVSAYGSKNIEIGQLAKFISEVEQGRIGDGNCLIIYSLDRLSRRSAWDEDTIQYIVKSGVEIHDVSTPVVLKRDDPFTKIIMELIVQRANNESKIKSERSTSGWQTRFNNMVSNGKIMTRRLPRWLDSNKNGYIVKENEVDIIHQIFNDYINGQTSPVIAKRLNAENKLINGSLWRPNGITKLIKDRRLLGFFCRNVNDEEVPNIFPKIIDDETFQHANSILKVASSGIKGRPRYNEEQRTVRNILTGIIRCGKCGGRVTTSVNSKGDRYIRCRNRINFEICNADGFKYDLAEKVIFSHVKQVDFSSIINGTSKLDQLSGLKSELLQLEIEENEWLTAIDERKKTKQRISIAFATGLSDVQERIDLVKQEIVELSLNEAIPDFEQFDIDILLNPENVDVRLAARKMLLQVLDTVAYTRDENRIGFNIKYRNSVFLHALIANIKTHKVISHGSVSIEGDGRVILKNNFFDLNMLNGEMTMHDVTDLEELEEAKESLDFWKTYLEHIASLIQQRSK